MQGHIEARIIRSMKNTHLRSFRHIAHCLKQVRQHVYASLSEYKTDLKSAVCKEQISQQCFFT